ncbi:hypothetical protein [Desulfotomaculum copahuensis]|uniref:hypothetical protein n=1 Tax=Desulfotomaculum copahuensis TaxID=1838280 RepID=UPI00124683DD|nr:hypothetical protein [Desulfotomaculum copahuensis]
MEQEVADLKQCCRELAGSACAPVVVEKLCVERISVDRLEFTNNLGALGIRELSGSLNIGANYGVPPGKKGGPPPSGATSPPVPPPGATPVPGHAGGKEARSPGKKAGAPAPPGSKGPPPPSPVPGVDGSPPPPSGPGMPGPSSADRKVAPQPPVQKPVNIVFKRGDSIKRAPENTL